MIHFVADNPTMADGLPNFDLTDVIIDDATWDGNNIVVRVRDPGPVPDLIPHDEEVGPDTVPDEQDVAVDRLGPQTVPDHLDVPVDRPDSVRAIDDAASLDVLQFVN